MAIRNSKIQKTHIHINNNQINSFRNNTNRTIQQSFRIIERDHFTYPFLHIEISNSFFFFEFDILLVKKYKNHTKSCP